MLIVGQESGHEQAVLRGAELQLVPQLLSLVERRDALLFRLRARDDRERDERERDVESPSRHRKHSGL